MKDNDEESDQKFEHNSSDDNSSSKDDESSDDKEDVMCYLGIDNLSHGTWRTRYYVGNLTDITSYKRESEITLNLMKKYNVRGKNLYFIYPLRAYIVVVDDLPVSKCL